MGASCGGHDIYEDDYTKVGLEPNHAYSILDIQQVTLEPGVTKRLVRLRNPWGKYSWSGPWSDHDLMWKKYSSLRQKLRAMEAKKGIFWMEVDDFF